MILVGACHCGNITYELTWPGNKGPEAARRCSCSFCTIHGNRYISHPDAVLEIRIRQDDLVSRYRFGTETADFLICGRCGVMPAVVSASDGRLKAVININTLKDFSLPEGAVETMDYDGESLDDRLTRRGKNWIATVQIKGGQIKGAQIKDGQAEPG